LIRTFYVNIPKALPPRDFSPLPNDKSIVSYQKPEDNPNFGLEIIFRTLLEMKYEMTDMKRMLHTISQEIESLKVDVLNDHATTYQTITNEELPVISDENINLIELEKKMIIYALKKNDDNSMPVVKETTYVPQKESKDAGAIALEKVNVNHIYDVIIPAIQDEFTKGKRGAELGEAIREKFSYKNDEPRPIPFWQDPVKFAEEELLYRQTLKRGNASDEEIEEIIKKWRGDI